ncbi:MAG: efflux RND transporter permease subunit [Acidobacteriota bacterium]
MIISDGAIKRPVLTVVAMMILVIFGVFALMKLEVDEFPQIDAPVVTVLVPYPGAAPDQVERDVVDPLEEQFSALSGIDKVQSKSIDGFATITAIFEFGRSADQAAQDIRDAMSTVRGQLPTTILDPIIQKFDPNALPIVSLVLSSTRLTTPELTQIADPGITKVLRGLNGVAQVRLSGNIDREVKINVRPKDLASMGVNVTDVVQAVQTQNISTPVGRITGPFQENSIRFLGRIEDPRDFSKIIVSTRGGSLVRLGDVADVVDGTAEPRSAAMLNGAASVGIDVTKTSTVSTTRVADQVLAKIAEIRKTVPPGVRVDVIRNSGDRVRQSVRNVEEALVEGALLTVLVVFLFLNSWRSTVITGLALPVSVMAAFVPVWLFGFTLNTMSLLGLSLAIGILIDDAIVVRENIVRHVEMGADHLRAAHEGTDEIGVAVTATTLSIVAVFVPVAFMPGFAGQWFKPFALTIAAAVLVSLFVSFSLDPMLSAFWPDPQLEESKRSPITRILDRFNRGFDRLTERYTGVIAWALDHRWWMVLIIVVALGGAIGLQLTIGGSSFVPETDNSELTITVETAPGSTLDYTRSKTEEIAVLARKHPEVIYTYSNVGSSDGSGTVDSGSIYIKLKAKKERSRSQQQLAVDLREQIRNVAGATAYLANTGPGGGGGKQLQIQIRGDDLKNLNQAAIAVMNQVRSVRGATDVGLSTRGERPELTVDLDRSLAATLGFTPADVANALRSGFAGVDAGDWVDPTGRTRDVTVRLAPDARTSESDVAGLPLVARNSGGVAAKGGTPAGGVQAGVETASNAVVPVGQVASITKGRGPTSIDHFNRDKIISVGANVEGRPMGDVLRDVQRKVANVRLPAGVFITQGGQAESQSEVFGGILSALLLAVMLMYFILVVQFGSFLDPIAILISLPLSLIGVVLALIITRDTLNLMSLIGVMLLMGIVAKNAILLIDFAKWNHEAGKPLRESLIEAGRVRLRPILMTTFALIAGMIPVAIGAGEGGDFRAPLGRAVIGGTITSTLLTLLVIPTVYEILYDGGEWLKRALARVFGRRHASEETEEAAV